MYFAGIDGGGTKSRLMAVDENGRLYGPYIGKSTNIYSNPVSVVQSNIKSLILDFMSAQEAELDALAGFCLGSAGVDLPQNVLDYEEMLRGIGLGCPLKVVNDVEIVLESEAKGQPGIVAISGTGSIVFGKDETKAAVRVGGWGYLVGDEGSGYWIGREAVRRSLCSYDGRGEETVLIPLLMEACKLKDLSEIINMIYAPDTNKSDVAAFSRLVDQAARAQDRVAGQILEEAAEDLAAAVCAARKRMQLPEEFPVILSGGTILGSEILYRKLVSKLETITGNIRRTQQEPCMGAVYLARNCAL